jgi:hypothetical protein
MVLALLQALRAQVSPKTATASRRAAPRRRDPSQKMNQMAAKP